MGAFDISKISKRAKQIRKGHPSMSWQAAIKKASAEHNGGKRVGKVAKKVAKKKKYKQTGTSDTPRDKQRKAKPPGRRRTKSGSTYTETRKNRTDAPGRITGVPSQLQHEMRQVEKAEADIIWARAQMKGATAEVKRRLRAAIKYSQRAKAVHKKNLTNLKRLI